ncbi:hypothetical protein [Ornithinimicrobium faecis]|uniref:Uncharacterized protein n=1 Tax=Ornithinimicrobium faecis TaxID=2934158 RepID=A0ABY4YYQ5_9MICO|nr:MULTISPECIES: hypothetical protein [unclassified Ornithinimicrobium]USQ81737.1 hypothetical protein NF556_08860 [Ornithinimicrobium sp. HY1793]
MYDRITQDVLPLFDERHGLMPDSLSAQAPEQVPADQFWIRDWVRAHADEAG